MTEEIIREYQIGEFRGNYPEVPFAEGVDVEAIKKGDPDALFVTLPIAEIGAVSNNGLLYDEMLVDSIAEQINRDRPGGIFGHLKDDDRPTAFPLPAGLWLGAKRHGERLWAISYVVPGAAREYMRTLKNTGGQIATSIYGRGKSEKVRDGVKRLLNFKLESLDYAPPGRAALGMGAVPHLTSEMDLEQEPIMADKAQVIAELTVADIPVALRDAIVAEASRQDESQATIAELTNTVTAKDEVISELNKQVEAYRLERLDAVINARVAELTDWQTRNDEDKAVLQTLRDLFRKQIDLRMGDKKSAERVSEVWEAAWADLKPIAEMARDRLSGPAAIVNGKVRETNGRKPLEDTPENRVKAAAAMGINI